MTDKDALIGELRKALAFAQSVIKSGEQWTAACEEVIGGALAKARQVEESGDG